MCCCCCCCCRRYYCCIFFWKFKLNLFFFLLIFMIMLFLFTVSFVRSFVCYLFVFVIRNRFGWCRIGSILCRILSLLSVYSRSKYSVKHLVRYWLQVHSRIIKGLPLPCPALPCLALPRQQSMIVGPVSPVKQALCWHTAGSQSTELNRRVMMMVGNSEAPTLTARYCWWIFDV